MKPERRIALFLKKEKRQPKAWEICPRADSCNINRCPLHEDFSKLQNDASDFAMVHKQKCIPKHLRKEIGTFFDLKNAGLTPKELSFAKYWGSLTPEQQEAKKQELAKNSPFARLKSKGYAITRVKKDSPDFTIQNTQEPPADTPESPIIKETKPETTTNAGGGENDG